MNARGIPTAAYQVLHLLPEVGYPPWPSSTGEGGLPEVGYPSRQGYPPGQVQPGVPPARVPPRARSYEGTLGGVPPWQGYPWPGPMGGVPEVGYPLARSDGEGVPKVGYPPPGWTWPGYPPRCGQTDGQTRVKT